MIIFQDWKFWLFIFSIIQTALMIYGFIVIKFNDLHHLAKDVSKIQIDIEGIKNKVIAIDKEVAVQDQRITSLEKV